MQSQSCDNYPQLADAQGVFPRQSVTADSKPVLRRASKAPPLRSTRGEGRGQLRHAADARRVLLAASTADSGNSKNFLPMNAEHTPMMQQCVFAVGLNGIISTYTATYTSRICAVETIRIGGSFMYVEADLPNTPSELIEQPAVRPIECEVHLWPQPPSMTLAQPVRWLFVRTTQSASSHFGTRMLISSA
jgi:hypothetical protein